MPIELPKEPVKATRIDPAMLIIYGAKKVGKTGKLVELPGCLTLDGEFGTETYDAIKLPFSSVAGVKEIVAAIKEEGRKRVEQNKAALAAGKPEPYPGDAIYPYRYLAVDTVDALEEDILPYALAVFKQTSKGKESKVDSVLELDYGLGHYYIREAMKEMLKLVASVCKTIIVVSHLNEKEVDKGGVTTTTKDISLMGKLSNIVCAMADAIGYVYRKPGAPGTTDKLMISFRTTEGITMGARQKHLAGQTFEFDWAKIFIDDPALKKQSSEPLVHQQV